MQITKNKNSRKVALLVLAMLLPLNFLFASDVNIEQKMSFGLPDLSFKRVTATKSRSYSTSIGLATEYTLFLTSNVGVIGQFVMNLQGQQIIFMGGGGGAIYYFIGGVSTKYEDPYFTTTVTPKFHLYGFLGLTARSFDFTYYNTLEANLPQNKGQIPTPDGSQDVPQGSFFGPFFGFGSELPINLTTNIGFRMQIFQSLASKTAPTINGQEIWIYTSVLL